MKRPALNALVAAWLGLAASAGAQTSDKPNAQPLEPVEILGTREQGYRPTVAPSTTKTDTPLSQQPVSAQVVSRELIEDRGVRTFGEAIRTVPGIFSQVGFGGVADRYRIRGFTSPSNLRNGFRRAGFVTLDELVNVEQIEILKGPASALYGRFEPGGVVNIVTKKPRFEHRTAVDFTAGDFDLYRATLDTTAALTDAVAYRFNALVEDTGSYRDFFDSRRLFVAPALTWNVGDRTAVNFEVEYGRRDGGVDRGFGASPLFFQAPIERNFGEPSGYLDNTTWLGLATIDHRLTDAWSLRFGAMRSHAEQDYLFVNFGFPLLSGATGPNPIVNRRAQISDDEVEQDTAQLELYGRIATGAVKHKLLVGVEYARDDWQFSGNRGPNVPISFFNPVYGQPLGPYAPFFDGGYTDRTTALYAQDEIELTPALRVLLGARYDRNRSTAIDNLRVPPLNVSRDDSELSPRVGVTWLPVPEVSLYASWAQSYRSELDAGLVFGGGLPQPSIGRQTEIGAKFNLLDGRLTPTIALFKLKRSNGTTADPVNPGFIISSGEQLSEGVEVDVPYAISRSWRLLASAMYLEATVGSSTTLPTGNRLNNAPRVQAALWTTYDFAGGFSLGAGAVHLGERAANDANTLFIPAYTRFDANAYYRWKALRGEWRAQLNVLNIGDKKYYDSGGSFVPLYPQAPRTITATIGYAFR